MHTGSSPQTVYVAIACAEVEHINAKVAFSCYWGPNNVANEALGVPGQQTESRASLAAIVRVLQMAPSNQSLIVYSRSQYAIRAFVYGAPAYSARGWACKNDDLLRVGAY
jgi:hypothetical protein